MTSSSSTNLSNSNRLSLHRVEEICGQPIAFAEVDLRNEAAVKNVFQAHQFDAVIHFAALKAVGESTRKPLEYYHNNIAGLLNLVRVMVQYQVFNLVYSSSATVYGENNPVPYVEENCHWNRQARTAEARSWPSKSWLMSRAADRRWKIVSLRYFNPIGAHPSGSIGEDPLGVPNNLMPYVCQVAVGKRDYVQIFGDDYQTRDGTGRSRITSTFVDLAAGHLAALDYLSRIDTELTAFNLGSGRGHSVYEVIRAFEKACGHDDTVIGLKTAVQVTSPSSMPTPTKRDGSWVGGVTRSLDDMCADAWRWQSRNPRGFADA